MAELDPDMNVRWDDLERRERDLITRLEGKLPSASLDWPRNLVNNREYGEAADVLAHVVVRSGTPIEAAIYRELIALGDDLDLDDSFPRDALAAL